MLVANQNNQRHYQPATLFRLSILAVWHRWHIHSTLSCQSVSISSFTHDVYAKYVFNEDEDFNISKIPGLLEDKVDFPKYTQLTVCNGTPLSLLATTDASLKDMMSQKETAYTADLVVGD